MIEDTAKIANEAIDRQSRVSLIINNRAGSNAPLIVQKITACPHTEEQQCFCLSTFFINIAISGAYSLQVTRSNQMRTNNVLDIITILAIIQPIGPLFIDKIAILKKW